jgi:hypothetical protein
MIGLARLRFGLTRCGALGGRLGGLLGHWQSPIDETGCCSCLPYGMHGSCSTPARGALPKVTARVGSARRVSRSSSPWYWSLALCSWPHLSGSDGARRRARRRRRGTSAPRAATSSSDSTWLCHGECRSPASVVRAVRRPLWWSARIRRLNSKAVVVRAARGGVTTRVIGPRVIGCTRSDTLGLLGPKHETGGAVRPLDRSPGMPSKTPKDDVSPSPGARAARPATPEPDIVTVLDALPGQSAWR